MGGHPVDSTPFGLGDRSGLGSAFAFRPLILCVTRLADGRLVDVNEAFLRATGYMRDELIGRRMEDLGLWIEPDIRARGLAALREGRGVRDTEARFRAKHGGAVEAWSAGPETGSEFVVRLPALPADAVGARAVAAPPRIAARRRARR